MVVRRILVVETDASIQEFLRLALVDEGYDVVVASRITSAQEIVCAFAPDLIILNMQPPFEHEQNFVAHYRASVDKSAPIIALSTSPKFIQLADQFDVDLCVAKPFDLEELLASVKYYVF